MARRPIGNHPNYDHIDFPDYQFQEFPKTVWPPGEKAGAKGMKPLGVAQSAEEEAELLAAVAENKK